MAFKVVESLCIGCGACDYACTSSALAKTDSFMGLFAIDPYRCNDCSDCVPKCPEDAIVEDPDWVVCHGHGCPLSSDRLGMVECNIFADRCDSCGGPMWRNAGEAWGCPRCDAGRKVGCPKIRMFDKVPVPDPIGFVT